MRKLGSIFRQWSVPNVLSVWCFIEKLDLTDLVMDTDPHVCERSVRSTDNIHQGADNLQDNINSGSFSEIRHFQKLCNEKW